MAMVGWFVEVYRRRGLKVNAAKSKLKGEEGLEFEIHLDGVHLEHIFKFKHLGCVLEKVSKAGAECNRKVASGIRVAGATSSLVNTKDLQI